MSSISTQSIIEYLNVRTLAAGSNLNTDSLAALVQLADRQVCERLKAAQQQAQHGNDPAAHLTVNPAANPAAHDLMPLLDSLPSIDQANDTAMDDMASIAQLVELASDVIQRL